MLSLRIAMQAEQRGTLRGLRAKNGVLLGRRVTHEYRMIRGLRVIVRIVRRWGACL